MFLYVVPSIAINRLSQVLSIGFGLLTIIPMIIGPIIWVFHWARGKKPPEHREDLCPCCGQPMPDSFEGGQAHRPMPPC
jgi:hypothetical protein